MGLVFLFFKQIKYVQHHIQYQCFLITKMDHLIHNHPELLLLLLILFSSYYNCSKIFFAIYKDTSLVVCSESLSTRRYLSSVFLVNSSKYFLLINKPLVTTIYSIHNFLITVVKEQPIINFLQSLVTIRTYLFSASKLTISSTFIYLYSIPLNTRNVSESICIVFISILLNLINL